jgi:hypothetical protein
MDLRGIGWNGMDSIDLPQDRGQWRGLVIMVMKLRVPQNVGKFLKSCTTGGFSRRTQLHEVSQSGIKKEAKVTSLKIIFLVFLHESIKL